MRRILAGALAAILAGCASDECTKSVEPVTSASDPEPRAVREPEVPPAAAAGGNAAGDPGSGEQPLLGLPEIVAEMDGRKITREELLRRSVEWFGREVLEEIILRHVFECAVKDSGVSITDKELAARVDQEMQARERETQQKYKMTLKEYLAQLGKTVDQLRTEIGKNEDLQRQILLEYMLGYAYLTEPRVSLSHLVVGDARKAAALREQVVQGADFGKVAQTESDDANSAKDGGKLPEFIRGMTRLGEKFEDAAFALQNPGELSAVVETRMGFHVLRLNKRFPANPQTFENLREQVRGMQKERSALESFMRRLREQYVKGLRYAVPDLEPKKK
ncbi:MAG: Periplasmic parvulin-like peptidyl-prolyl [Planctomycetota bacterium]|nr:MAG: Periplasmic parvulin-like peptidyl-prolyl [Planctomycetota bacterium]